MQCYIAWRESTLGEPLEQVFRIINEQTRQPAENPVFRVLREGTVVDLANNTVLIAREGEERPIDDCAAPIRDEGTSYHSLPPGREVAADPRGLEILRDVLECQDHPYRFGKTWTTDAVFRETRGKIQARRAEGALVVEMETAALFAIGAFRNVLVAQLLYAGDSVGGEIWDHRDWGAQKSIRKSLFFLACEACCEAASGAAASLPP